MSTQRAILLLAVVIFASALHTADHQFEDFKIKFNKHYTSAAEELKARSTFAKNLEVIKKHQVMQPHATMGVTQFADMTETEFAGFVHKTGSVSQSKRATAPPTNVASVPSKVDWVAAGAVGPVQNQGQCGDDYVFSTLANIAGVNVVSKKLKEFVPLSLQEIITCMNAGCNGGLLDSVYQFLITKEHGLVATAASWPPQDNTTCTFDGKTIGCVLTSYQALHPSEDELTTATATYGPINVAVDALSWQFYTGGILTACKGTQVDHAVITVGYDDTYSTPYWTLQNSWGTSWGENGYIRIAKGKNLCGIATSPVTGFVQH